MKNIYICILLLLLLDVQYTELQEIKSRAVCRHGCVVSTTDLEHMPHVYIINLL